MRTWHVLVGGALVAMATLAGYEVRRDRARAEAMREEVARLRSDLDSGQRQAGAGPVLRALVAATRAAPAADPVAGSAEPAPAPAPREPERPRPMQPAEVRERIDGVFAAERADASWAGGAQHLAEGRLPAVLPEGSEVRSVECRAALCRIETSHADGDHYQEFVRKAFLNPETKLWNGGFFSTPLEDASQAEGRFVVVAYLARDGQSIPVVQ